MTSPPEKLIIWLLDEAIKAIKSGKQAVNAKDIAEQNLQIQRAQQLIIEVIPMINGSIEGGKKFMIVLDYLSRRLIEANIKSEVFILNEIELFLLEISDAWKEVLKN